MIIDDDVDGIHGDGGGQAGEEKQGSGAVAKSLKADHHWHFDRIILWITWSALFVRVRVASQRKEEIGVGRRRKIGAEGDWLLRQATSQAVVSTNTSTSPTVASTTLLTSKVVARLRSFLG